MSLLDVLKKKQQEGADIVVIDYTAEIKETVNEIKKHHRSLEEINKMAESLKEEK